MTEGFLIVASRDPEFGRAAVRCAESIKDEWPGANICIATHADWVTDRMRGVAEIISPVPDHSRAKLWVLSKTPWERTQYVDADMMCVHGDVQTIFDIEPDAPLLMTENRAYNSKVVYFNAERELHHRAGAVLHEAGEAERLRWHCGFFRYDLPATAPLMSDWLAMLAENHANGPGQWGPPSIAWWDTYAFWRCWRERQYDFEVAKYPDPDARWQFIDGYREDELDGTEPVFMHYTIPGSNRQRRGDGDMARMV